MYNLPAAASVIGIHEMFSVPWLRSSLRSIACACPALCSTFATPVTQEMCALAIRVILMPNMHASSEQKVSGEKQSKFYEVFP